VVCRGWRCLAEPALLFGWQAETESGAQFVEEPLNVQLRVMALVHEDSMRL
jgi:hypothetical protein